MTRQHDNVVITERMPDGMPQWVDDAMIAGTLFAEIKARYLMEETLLFEQREMCAKAAMEYAAYHNGLLWEEFLDGIGKACLNAVEQPDV